MELITLGKPWSWLYNLAGRLGRRPKTLRVIGGADGPTAIFTTSYRRPKRDNGVLVMKLNWAEVLLAARLAVLLVAALALLVSMVRQRQR